ncbi:RNA-directed DNA polymerase [Streptomyces malaysiensis subsp. malaysiensis]|nr:group II intron reverse transcriptase/maturase [Streptomyces sp. NA07423]WHX15597.1 RNA-directed DNA polymerase [Streptomyces sp. NA07423]
MDPNDPGFRGLRYVRYADDTLLGFIGPRSEAEEIKHSLAVFLREDLKLELSPEKTLITHARKGAASFLGYEITVQHSDRQSTRGRRTANGSIALRVPAKVIREKAAPYFSRGKPAHRSQLLNDDDYTIVNVYGAEYRGIVQYYLLAGNVCRLNRLRWVMETSLLKTLAVKHRSTVPKIAARYKAKVETPYGLRTCFEASVPRSAGRKLQVVRFGGISLTRQKAAVLMDRQVAFPSPKRADQQALEGKVRAMRDTGRRASAPHPKTR